MLRALFRLRYRVRVRVAIGFYIRFRVWVKERTGIVLSPGLKVLIRLVRGIDGGAIVAGANVMEPF